MPNIPRRRPFAHQNQSIISRRNVLKGALLGAGAVAFPGVLAACGDDDGDGGGGGGDASGELEVFSWWTGGGEEAGLNEMIAIWENEHPDVEFVNAAVAGGAGSNAMAVLTQRLGAGDPPDSFQGHAGAELADYINAQQLEAVNFIYEEEGFTDVFPQQLVDQITVDGNIYSVPVNIHRANMLWFNPGLLQQAGLSAPPETMDAFVAALEAAQGTGKIALALAEQWTTMHLLETVMLAELGAEDWTALWTPDGDWGSDSVTAGLERYAQILGFVNEDFSSLTWQDAAKLVTDGEAVFNVMGDWAAGYFTVDLALEPETGFGFAPVPGTDGVYQWLSDSFTLPDGAPNRDAAIEWLRLCGSLEGQDAFNPKKGSIPARDDADRAKYGPYLLYALDEWQSNELAGSLAHGVVASNAWKTAIDTALGLFLGDRAVETFQQGLVDAHDANAPS
ncbi:MAG: ABC transporter substrate-binding protein [Acidimicrobiales bacterium]